MRFVWSLIVLFLVVGMGATEIPPQAPRLQVSARPAPPQAPPLKSFCPCGPDCGCGQGGACSCKHEISVKSVTFDAPQAPVIHDTTVIYRNPENGRRWRYTTVRGEWDYLPEPVPLQPVSAPVFFVEPGAGGFGGPSFAPPVMRGGFFRGGRGGCSS